MQLSPLLSHVSLPLSLSLSLTHTQTQTLTLKKQPRALRQKGVLYNPLTTTYFSRSSPPTPTLEPPPPPPPPSPSPSPMNGTTTTTRLRSPPKTKSESPPPPPSTGHFSLSPDSDMLKKKSPATAFSGKKISGYVGDAHFLKWTAADIFGVPRHHPMPCVFAAALLFFMGVEYTLSMIPPTAAPFDLGFVATATFHRLLAARPALNTLLAGLNTVFVGMQTAYIIWTWVIEGRPRATISALYMFTCRGILGYATQLPLPQDFLGSGADFPVGNVSFFLFYSGHVAASVIASLDMKRMKRWELAYAFDTLNVLQAIRLLTTRGHYTIDLAVGVGAGMLFDSLAGKYVDSKKITLCNGNVNGNGALHKSPK